MEIRVFVIIACLLLISVLIYQEIRRPHKERLFWRVTASIVAVTCFALLVIPISYESDVVINSNELILVTEGADVNAVNKLSGTKYSLNNSSKTNSYRALADLPYFLQSHPEIRKIQLFGYGLPENELEKLTDYQIIYHGGTELNGLTSARWPTQIKEGERLTIQGKYENTEKSDVQLLLKGLGRTIDSIKIPTNSKRNFSFNDRPKLIGQAVYQLIALRKSDTLSNEPVPFEVTEASPLKILMLASFPDFEYKFLKNWLFENHYPLAFRSRISKDKFTTDFLNIESFPLNKIASSSIKNFNLLIIDEEELVALNPDERNVISNAVDQGLGLIVRVSEIKALTPLSNKFPRVENLTNKNKPLNLTVINNNFKLSPLPAEQILFLRSSQADQSLISDQEGKSVVVSSLKGNGKIINSTISATYQWLLTGKKNDYFTYWSELLNNATRKENKSISLKISPQFPTVNQKAKINISLAESGKVPLIIMNNIKLSPRQNMELPFQWDVFYWPQQAGWSKLKVNQQQLETYFYEQTDWRMAKSQQLININRIFSKANQNNEQKKLDKREIIKKQISLWWFFIGFLLCLAYLWYESKVLAQK